MANALTSPPTPAPQSRSAGRASAVVYCFGQSNAICVASALKRGLFRPSDPTLAFEVILSDPKRFPPELTVVRSPSTGKDEIFPGLTRAFEDRDVLSGSRETWLLSVVLGSEYNRRGLFEPDPPFDFVSPDCPSTPLRPGVQIVPYAAIRALFSEAAETLRRFYACLPRHNVAGVLHLEAPPPIPSERQCKTSIEGLLLHKHLGVRWNAAISPREFRMKLWKCQSDVNREVCRDHGVTYVTPPQDALDGAGYLAPFAWWGATHGNATYGKLALQTVETRIRELRRDAGVVSAARG